MIITSVCLIPNRISLFKLVLDDLLKSSILPDFIYISVCKYYPRLKLQLPINELEELEIYLEGYPISNRIIIHDIDIGPCLKLLTPLREHKLSSEDVIIIFDDDTGLFPTAIESLLNGYNSCGKYGIFGIMGINSGEYFHGELMISGDWYPVDVLGGYRGVLYPFLLIDSIKLEKWISMFIEGFDKYGLIPIHDDQILSYFFKHNGIPLRVVNVYPKEEINYFPKETTNGIFQDSNSQETLLLVDEILKLNGINI